MNGATGKVAAVIAAVLIVVLGGVLAVLRPWETEAAATDNPTEDNPTGDNAIDETTVLAVGDIGRCDDRGDEQTAEIVRRFPQATVLALGDIAYENGTKKDFAECFDPSWGSFTERIRPVPGNHEYRTDGAAPYFDYFGTRAGDKGKGWYSFDLGDWHIVALNSNCEDVGCEEGSEQETWLRADLEASDARCTMAFWHAPRFSSGSKHGGTKDVADLWQALLDSDVELLLSGHEHLYERTAPLNADGDVDEAGTRQFIAGTGGGNHYPVGKKIPGSEATLTNTNGVLKMSLRPAGYDWEFVAVAPNAAADRGSAECR